MKVVAGADDDDTGSQPATPFRSAELRCSFCGLPLSEVAQLIAGPEVHICDACVSVCGALVREQRAAAKAATKHVRKRADSADWAYVLVVAVAAGVLWGIFQVGLALLRGLDGLFSW